MSEIERSREQERSAFKETLQNLSMEVYEKTKDNNELYNWSREKQDEHERKIKEAGFDVYEYLSHHLVWGGTASTQELDFPGEFSWEKFYKDHLVEIENKLKEQK